MRALSRPSTCFRSPQVRCRSIRCASTNLPSTAHLMRWRRKSTVQGLRRNSVRSTAVRLWVPHFMKTAAPNSRKSSKFPHRARQS